MEINNTLNLLMKKEPTEKNLLIPKHKCEKNTLDEIVSNSFY